jgi:hypothetical protein
MNDLFDDMPEWSDEWSKWDPVPTPNAASINEIHAEMQHIASSTKCSFVCFDMAGDIVGACECLDDAMDIHEVASIMNPAQGLAWAKVVQDLSILQDVDRLSDPVEVSLSFAFSRPAPLRVGVALIAQIRMLDL